MADLELKVLGCHGGETVRHRTSSFLLGDRLALDAGAATGTLTLEEQRRIDAVLVSHAHMDHVRDLASLADNRCQQGGPPIEVVGTPGTIATLREHFFNDALWPDFTRIRCCEEGPVVVYREVGMEEPVEVLGHRVTAIPVDHTIESAAFLVEKDGAAIAYSGDTGPTDRLWEVLGETPHLRGLIMEVSFPDEMAELARVSGHHTPSTLQQDLRKLRGHDELPIFLFHIKPAFESAVERQLARLREERHLVLLQLEDTFLLGER